MTYAPLAPPALDVRRLLAEEGPAGAADRLSALHPVEITEALEPLNDNQRFEVVSRLSKQQAAQVLLNADAAFRQGLLSRLAPEAIAVILQHLPMENASALLDQLPDAKTAAVYQSLPPEDAEQLRALHSYPAHSVGRLMVRRVPRFRPGLSAGQALEQIRRTNVELQTINNIYVVDEQDRLVGVIALRELVVADPEHRLRELMQTRLVTVTPQTDREAAAHLVSRYNFLALPVVEDGGQLLGIVTVDDLIDVLIQEDTEDVLRLGGVGGHEGPLEATPYWAGRIAVVVRKRISWLLLLFVAETFTGSVLRHFGHELQKVVALSFFIPLLIGTGGNAGSQTVTTIVRGLALGEIRLSDGLRVMARELATGLLLGLLLGAFAFGRALLWGVSMRLAFTVGITILVICAWANTVGSVVPLAAQRLRIDPTVVSAPFITTLVDATGLVIYFLIARAMLGL